MNTYLLPPTGELINPENSLQIFTHLTFGEIRTVVIDGQPYVIGNDIAAMLEYARPYEAVSAHCKGAVSYRVTDSLGRLQDTKVIPEGDIYRLIVKAADQSKNLTIAEKAEKVERWIFDEVLPSIRKHGAYLTPETIEKVLDDPDTVIRLATKLKAERQRRQALEAKVEANKPLVSFAETCATSQDSILVRELAKLACKQGINIGEHRLYRILRVWGMIFKNSTEPYQEYVDRGYFEVTQSARETSKGTRLFKTTRVTAKGQIYIIDRLKKEIV